MVPASNHQDQKGAICFWVGEHFTKLASKAAQQSFSSRGANGGIIASTDAYYNLASLQTWKQWQGLHVTCMVSALTLRATAGLSSNEGSIVF